MSSNDYKISKGVVYPPPPTLASDEEFAAGISTTASPSVKQVKDKYVTLDTEQAISTAKNFTGNQTLNLLAETNQQTVPSTSVERIIRLYQNTDYSKGDGCSSWISGYRGKDGRTSTLINARRFLEDDANELIASLEVGITPEGTRFASCPTTPTDAHGTQIATANWVLQNALPTGTIIVWSTATAPTGYLICDGSAISRTTYSNLFSVIGTTYGEGDGSTTFNVPNCTNYVPWQSVNIAVGGRSLGNLPNITGTFGKTQTISNDSYGNGAFSVVHEGSCGDANSGATNLYHWTFDASRCSAIYADADRVIPALISMKWCL